MNKSNFLTVAALGIALPLALLQGCGGGGGGSSSPSPTSTPSATARSLVVQLRDAASNPVDGIVTVGSTVQATTDGQTTFRFLAAGRVTVSAEVNGLTTSGTATVGSSGATNFVLTITTAVTPAPTTTVPPPPF